MQFKLLKSVKKGRRKRATPYLFRVIRASPDISADARHYDSLIFIVADSLRPISAINYARRANYVRSTDDSRRRIDMRSMSYATGKLQLITAQRSYHTCIKFVPDKI